MTYVGRCHLCTPVTPNKPLHEVIPPENKIYEVNLG